eukprot:CAMPEP_0182472084 /NCGR_PEP_ID=MMETSP1319-20130603/21510_1 /TAXON_ID=172717 /ORGANISM="Bolidomonas pacifica, Strain RCC208" /LENGTH=196 /DNA_ID=CAMNT_0024672715 /DNA_START=104 /DNA_END=694 /DNA_ORIENTATION=-
MGTWVEKYDPTIEDQYTKTIELDGKAIQLEILDTAGQECYSPLRETFMHTGDGFILAYSITDDQTYEDLTSIREQILRVHPNRNVPMILVGNKCDMEEDRAVSVEEGTALAETFNKIPFIEISAKEDIKVTEAFESIVRFIQGLNPDAGSGEGSGGVLGAGIAAPAAPGSDSAGAGAGGSGGGGKKPGRRLPCLIL